MQRTMRNTVAASRIGLIGCFAGAAVAQGKIELLWLGQSATRIKTISGKVIMIDPWLINNP